MRTLLIAIAASALCGCTQYPQFDGPPPPAPAAAPTAVQAAPASVVYLPPTRGPAEAPIRPVAASRFDVVRSIEERAQRMGLGVAQRDDALGLVVAHYQGPPMTFIDCGTYSMPATAFSVPAGGSGITRAAASASGAERVNQDTQLNARLVALVESRGDAESRAQIEAHYVLRRDLAFVDGAGRIVQRNREFIDLTTERPARFSDDTACFATGELERSVLSAVIGFGS